ncbi:MAG TPA: DUF2071 domain-containing protein [Pirellulales bacterium]|nr:DUF2071 domain-containing protein [Pirellulales bacterium]
MRLPALHIRWQDLAFFHWPVEPASIAGRLPNHVALDTFDGRAWIGVTPFRMTLVRPAFAPPLFGISTFPELNVRTYVIAEGIPGIWFFSLDAMQWLAVQAARKLLNLPYHYARARIATAASGIDWQSHRSGAGPAGRFAASYRPLGEPYLARPGNFDYWFAERYCLYNVTRRGTIYRMAIRHPAWPLQIAEAELRENTMFEANRFAPADREPSIHFAREVDVWGCLPELL